MSKQQKIFDRIDLLCQEGLWTSFQVQDQKTTWMVSYKLLSKLGLSCAELGTAQPQLVLFVLVIGENKPSLKWEIDKKHHDKLKYSNFSQVGFLCPHTNHTNSETPEEPCQALSLQTLHQHPRLCCCLQHHLHALEHQISQGCWLPDRVERSLGRRGLLAPPLLSDPLRDHDPLEAQPEQPEVRLHPPPGQGGGLLLWWGCSLHGCLGRDEEAWR